MAKKYFSEEVDVYFDPAKCIHATECVKGLPNVFDTGRRPWVNPENGEVDEIVEVVERCPSGALTYVRKDGGLEESHPETTVEVGKDGEMYIKGNFTLTVDGEIVKLNRAALWSSDESDNPPFYDKSLVKREEEL